MKIDHKHKSVIIGFKGCFPFCNKMPWAPSELCPSGHDISRHVRLLTIPASQPLCSPLISVGLFTCPKTMVFRMNITLHLATVSRKEKRSLLCPVDSLHFSIINNIIWGMTVLPTTPDLKSHRTTTAFLRATRERSWVCLFFIDSFLL